METKTIESSFCFQYLSRFVGIKRSTIESLVANDYDSIHSLSAFDVDIDLNQLPNVSMGQKSILRDALNRLKTEINLWIKSETTTGSSSAHSVLNSTPIAKPKEYPFVNSDQMFKELIATAMSDIASDPHSGLILKPNISSFTDKQTDSGINGTDSELVSLSPIKRGRPSTRKTRDETLESENTENDQNSKRMKSSDNSHNQSLKTKRKRKKFLYSLNSSRNRKRNKPKNSPLSERKSNSQRKIIIDLNSSLGEATEESIPTEASEAVIDGNQKLINIFFKPFSSDNSQKSDQIELNANEKLFTISSPDDPFEWKKKKPEIIRLIKNKSKQIKLLRDDKMEEELSDMYKVVEINGIITPFNVCNLCFASNVFQLLITPHKSYLKKHLMSKRHQKVSPLLGTESNENSKLAEDSNSSAEEFSGVKTATTKETTKRGILYFSSLTSKHF